MKQLLPLDHPYQDRPHRLYVTLTNYCNRACPWCSTYSSPAGSTFLSFETFLSSIPKNGFFEIQLEGGEPTLHPDFWKFVNFAREARRCQLLVVCSNGTVLPRQEIRLRDWLKKFDMPITIKLSINHYLLEHDEELLRLALLLKQLMPEVRPENKLILNVRLRKGSYKDDQHVVDHIEKMGLMAESNIFFLQAYGLASEENWEKPYLVGSNFRIINPDGRIFGPELIARSEAMREMA
ncbi:radical SAM protein [Candidatus Riflebacteria bacterium]